MKWLKRNFGKNWWATQHICSDIWFPMQFRSFFGIPMTTCFFSVAGPFESKDETWRWIAQVSPESVSVPGKEDDTNNP